MRLFFAVTLDEKVREAISAVQKSITIPGARLVPVENLHITLQFLGDTSPNEVPK